METGNCFVDIESNIIVGKNRLDIYRYDKFDIILEKYVDPINNPFNGYNKNYFYFQLIIHFTNKQTNTEEKIYIPLKYVKNDLYINGQIFDIDKKLTHFYIQNYDHDILQEIINEVTLKAKETYSNESR